MLIREFTSADGMLMKQVRLRALRDAPYAFGGPQTLAEESALPDSHWHQLAAEVSGEVPAWKDRCVAYVVLDGDDDHACGTAASFLCPRVSRRAYFSAAWIDPVYRRKGIGRALVQKAIAWAIAHGADHLKLWVDDTNPGAAEFYKALGFVATGENRAISPDSPATERSFELRFPTPDNTLADPESV